MDGQASISLFLAVAGLATAAYSACRNGAIALWMPLAYFSLMAALTAFSRQVADECALPANQVAALLAYLHLCFQPFFINAVALHFADPRIARRIDLPVHTLCFTAAVMMLIQAYPFTWAGQCAPGAMLCGAELCTWQTGGYAAWSVPINAVSAAIPWYGAAAFALPFVYGAWRFMLPYLLAAPLPAFLFTAHPSAWPGVSALLAIVFLITITASLAIRGRMAARQWSH